MRRFIPLAIAATMAMGNLAFTSAQAAAEPLLTDIAGDANFLNGQGFVTGAGDNAGGISDGGADILTVGVVAGAKTELRIGVGDFEPSTPILVRTITAIGDCTVWLEIYSADMAGAVRLPSACGDSPAATYTDGITITQDEETIEWVMEFDFKALAPEVKTIIKKGAAAVGLAVTTTVRTSVPGAATLTAPTYDNAADAEVAFKF